MKPPGTKPLKLEYDGLLSNIGFKFKLRRYSSVEAAAMAYDDDVQDAIVPLKRRSGPLKGISQIKGVYKRRGKWMAEIKGKSLGIHATAGRCSLTASDPR